MSRPYAFPVIKLNGRRTTLSVSSSNRGTSSFPTSTPSSFLGSGVVSITRAVPTMLMHRDRQNEPPDDVAASQHPQQLCDLLGMFVSDCVRHTNKLDVFGGSDVLDGAVDLPCRDREGSLRLPRTDRVPQRLAERLLELHVDVALPVLAEVDGRDCRVAYHPQRDSGERNAAPFTGDVRGRCRS